MNFKRAEIFKNISFWKKFSHLLLIGGSALILLFIAQTSSFKNTQEVQAQDGNVGVGTTSQTAVFLNNNDAGAGGLVTAVNNTTGGDGQNTSASWSDPVFATRGNVIQFRVRVQETVPDAVAHNVMVKASLPGNTATNFQVSGTVSADNAASVSDNATINITDGIAQSMFYYDGHAQIFGVTSLWNCPNGCALPDTITSSGINLGDVVWGPDVQVTWKEGLSNEGGPTPTPTPSPSVTPTPTPNPTATPTPPTETPTPAPSTTTQSCPTGQSVVGVDQQGQIICQNISINVTAQGGAGGSGGSANATNNNTNNNTVSVTPSVITPVATQVLGATSLPKTGLPELAWSALAFIPAGFSMRRFSKSKKDLEDHPSYISEARQFKVNS